MGSMTSLLSQSAGLGAGSSGTDDQKTQSAQAARPDVTNAYSAPHMLGTLLAFVVVIVVIDRLGRSKGGKK